MNSQCHLIIFLVLTTTDLSYPKNINVLFSFFSLLRVVKQFLLSSSLQQCNVYIPSNPLGPTSPFDHALEKKKNCWVAGVIAGQ